MINKAHQLWRRNMTEPGEHYVLVKESDDLQELKDIFDALPETTKKQHLITHVAKEKP